LCGARSEDVDYQAVALWEETPIIAVKTMMILVHDQETRRFVVEIDQKLGCLEDLGVNVWSAVGYDVSSCAVVERVPGEDAPSISSR